MGKRTGRGRDIHTTLSQEGNNWYTNKVIDKIRKQKYIEKLNMIY